MCLSHSDMRWFRWKFNLFPDFIQEFDRATSLCEGGRQFVRSLTELECLTKIHLSHFDPLESSEATSHMLTLQIWNPFPICKVNSANLGFLPCLQVLLCSPDLFDRDLEGDATAEVVAVYGVADIPWLWWEWVLRAAKEDRLANVTSLRQGEL